MKKKRFMLYKIYYFTERGEDVLVYIGRTKQSMNARLHGHFFKAPMMREIDITQVSRIEYSCFDTEADMFVAEIILINRFKPALNRDDKAKDELTIQLPEFEFIPYECPHIERWKKEISERDLSSEKFKKARADLLEEHRRKRREVFSQTDISSDERAEQWTKWLIEYYEPALEEINNKEDITAW